MTGPVRGFGHAGATTVRPMVADDAGRIERQPSQRMALGIEAGVEVTTEIAADLIAGGEAWSVERGGRVVACLGLRETFPGVQGVAWAILAEGIGAAHLVTTRHARARIAASPLRRIEAVCRAGVDAEAILTAFPDLDPTQLLEAVLSVPSPETRWAAAAGLIPVHVLRKFGAASETHVLFERIA